MGRSSATSVRWSRPRSWQWQDIVPAVATSWSTTADVARLKRSLASGLAVPQLVSTAWAAASSFRGSDKRGGANGAGSGCSRRAAGRSTNPTNWPRCCARWKESSSRSTAATGGKKISLADLIILGGNAGVEKAAADAGVTVEVPFTPGRTDATAEQTDVESFSYLEPKADGFRNYLGKGLRLPAEYQLIDRANLLTLTAPETTVLVGGLRVLGANTTARTWACSPTTRAR